MKIAIVRGSYFNKYEMQNYEPLAGEFDIIGFSGLNPIHKSFKFPLKKLPSPVDLPKVPKKMPILNRLCMGDAMYLFGLEKALKGFDIVHTRETYFHFTQQALNAKSRGFVKKVVCTCSETIPFNHEGIYNRRKFKKRAIKEVDLFHCLTEKAKKCLIKEGCSPKKIVVFPYGVDVNLFSPNKSPITNHQSPVTILFIGRLEKEKGVNILCKVVKNIVKTSKNVNFTIIGKGQEKGKIINLINQINKVKNYSKESEKRIIYKNAVKYPNIANEYKLSNIFFLPSQTTENWEEYLGMSIIEAMASGLPIVSTSTGAIPEVVGNCGFLLKPHDIFAMQKTLKKLINNKMLRDKIGKKARKRAKKLFDKEKIANKIGKFWKNAYKHR